MATDPHRRTAFRHYQPNHNTERTAEIPPLHLLALSKAYPWQTKTFAANNHIEEQTARKRYSQTGSYFGVVPQKLANGRLIWPNVVVTTRGAIAANGEAIANKDGV